MKHKYYAEVKWVVEDVLDLRPEWTRKMAKDFLIVNEDKIIDGLIECGWEVIESLMKKEDI